MSRHFKHASKLSGLASTIRTILLIAGLLLATSGSAFAATPAPADARAADVSGAPHFLIENVGQYAPEARFLLMQGSYRIWVTDDAVWLTVTDPQPTRSLSSGPEKGRREISGNGPGTALRFTFAGASPAAVEPFGRFSTQVSYLIGSDPSLWQRDVPAWSGVRFRDLYPGIDLVIGGDAQGVIPWHFEAQEGANQGAVSLQVAGANAVTAEGGELRLDITGRTLAVPAPGWRVSGQANTLRSAVAADGSLFRLSPEEDAEGGEGPQASPDAADDDLTDLVYSRLAGGSLLDNGYRIAIDGSGNAFITGETASTNFPDVAGHYDGSHNGAADAFVVKYNPTAATVLYATYLGGSADDLGMGIAVSGGEAYVFGETQSSNFPGTPANHGGSDFFVSVLTPNGENLRYSTLLGGTGWETPGGIAIHDRDAFLVGMTDSADMAGTNCNLVATNDLVVARLNAQGQILYTHCLGGSDYDAGYGIAVMNQVAYVTGESYSTDLFPGVTLQGESDMLVAAFDPSGALVDVNLIGGDGWDAGNAIAAWVDAEGNGSVYVAGRTYSASFPDTNGTALAGQSDAVVVRVPVESFVHDFATFLGGTADEDGRAIAVDTVEGIYVGGATSSANFPFFGNPYDSSYNGADDAFVARLHPDSAAQNKVTYATYLGGRNDDVVHALVTDTGGHVFVTGATGGQGFPVTAGTAYAGNDDAFVAKLRVSDPPAPPAVTVAASHPDVVLTWNMTASRYQVIRSTQPYFVPGDWSSTILAESSTSPYHDTGVLASVDAHYYAVKAISGAPEQASPNSNVTGEFTFGLVKGQ